MSFLSLVGLRMLVTKRGYFLFVNTFSLMADLADILGVDQVQSTPGKEKKSKRSSKPDPYANLPRYLRDIVDENNPPPKDLFEEKKSSITFCL